MEIFVLTLSQMAMMLSFMAFGFFLMKTRVLPSVTDVVLSRLETYIFVPALNIYTMMNNCTIKTFRENHELIFYGAILIITAIAVSVPLSNLFVKNQEEEDSKYQRNIYKYAMIFSNSGFIGNFIVLGVWGEEALFKYLMFTFFISILCSSYGLYVLIPKDKGNSLSQNLIKGLTAPPLIGLLIGVIFGILNIKQYFPAFALDTLSNASDCMGPVAMILSGFVIGEYKFGNLIANKKIYILSFLRLIIIPAIVVLTLKSLGVNKEILILALIAFGSPLGLNTIVYPAAYGGNTKIGASMVMVSNALSLITIPLMYLLLIR